MRRPLPEALRDPGYTPGARDVDGLFALLAEGDDDTVERAGKALRHFGAPVARRAMALFVDAKPPLRGRLVNVVGAAARDHADDALRDFLVACLDDADAKSRRNAANALGHVAHPASERALIAYWKRDPGVEHRRSVARSLGQIGGGDAYELLRAVSTDDPELRRLVAQALVKLERTRGRGERSEIDGAARTKDPLPLTVWCRAGVESICAAEFGERWDPAVRGEAQVSVTLRGALKDVFVSRTMAEFGVTLPVEPVARGESVADAFARAVTSPLATSVWTTFTRGSARYRIAWAGEAHGRADTWRCVEAVAARDARLKNDPVASTWELVVRVASDGVRVVMVPKRLVDPRFAYRKGDVPASSHPTLAAALVRVAGVRADDVVFDPFVGSGLELCERVLAGPYRALIGRDRDPRVLDVARANLVSAGLRKPVLHRGDALDQWPAGVTLAITNPPFGHRASFGEDVAKLLEDFVRHAASSLAPKGRLVWVSPVGDRTRRVARQCGLTLKTSLPIELGGGRVEIQRFDREATAGSTRRAAGSARSGG